MAQQTLQLRLQSVKQPKHRNTQCNIIFLNRLQRN